MNESETPQAPGRELELQGEILELRKALTRSVRGEVQERSRREILELIARHRPLDDILTRVETLLEMRMSGVSCTLLAFPVQSNPMILGEEAPLELPEGGTAWSLAPLDPVRCALVHPALPSWWRDKGLRQGWQAPILFGGGSPLGVLCLGSRDTRLLRPEEEAQFETFSHLAGIAIHHSLLLDTLSQQARYDSLTGLPNRVLFQDRLEQAIHLAQRTEQSVGVLFLDLDGFKHINDTLGHHIGDNLLVEASHRLRDLLRQADTLARMGGDEFTVLLPSLKDPSHAGRVAEKCLESLREPFLILEHELFVTGSLGISVYPQDAKDSDQLHRNAALAMYQAKARGKNGFAFFTPDLNLRAQERLEMDGLLRRALDQGEFQLYYQPQFRHDGSLSGCEALLRWFHPRLGPISPARFIPVAEENGFILPIGNWVLREACRQLAAWDAPEDFLMAVNVSSLQFQREDWIDVVAQVLSDTGLPAARLELELTESLVMDNPQQAATRLTALRKLGVRVAVDDFGTGYSSLSYLQRLPLDTLKIDQSFVRDIFPTDDKPSSGPIVQTIVALARSLGLSLMAEGVETEEQAGYLRNLECEGMQGFLFGRPMPAEDFVKFFQTPRPMAAEGAIGP